jgi:hypothetical protein
MNTAVQAERLMQYCPGCGRLLRVPPELKGQKVACKFCDHEVTVGADMGPHPEHGLTHVGTGTAFQIERDWSAGVERESRFTVIRHPSKQPLRGYTMAVECFGPARVHLAGIRAGDGQAASMGKVRPNETRIVPLDDVCHAYLWLDKGANTRVRLIVGRSH